MLKPQHRRRAVELLAATALLGEILPGCGSLTSPAASDDWYMTLEILDRIRVSSFPVAFAALVRTRVARGQGSSAALRRSCSRLRLTTREWKELEFLLAHERDIRNARQLAWPALQRILIQDDAGDLLAYAEAIAGTLDADDGEIQFCRRKLALPADQLNPPPLITGSDLQALGVPPGPAYRPLLEALRDAQLEGRVRTPEEALQMAEQWKNLAPEH
jgi:hypothetical protein